MDSISEIVESLDELLVALDELSIDDDLHLALELGQQFRDELAVLSND
jgi:hypothetical protein